MGSPQWKVGGRATAARGSARAAALKHCACVFNLPSGWRILGGCLSLPVYHPRSERHSLRNGPTTVLGGVLRRGGQPYPSVGEWETLHWPCSHSPLLRSEGSRRPSNSNVGSVRTSWILPPSGHGAPVRVPHTLSWFRYSTHAITQCVREREAFLLHAYQPCERPGRTSTQTRTLSSGVAHPSPAASGPLRTDGGASDPGAQIATAWALRKCSSGALRFGY